MDSLGTVEPLLDCAALGSYDLPVTATVGLLAERRPVQLVHSGLKPSCLSDDRRLRFSPAIQFWFPGPDQLCLAPSSGSSAVPVLNSPPPPPFCGTTGEHVGFRSLLHSLPTPCRPGGRRLTTSACGFPADRTASLPDGDSGVLAVEDATGYDLVTPGGDSLHALSLSAAEHVGFRSLPTTSFLTAPSCAPVVPSSLSASEHVGFRSLPATSALSCGPCPSCPAALPTEQTTSASNGTALPSSFAAPVPPFRLALSQSLDASAASAPDADVTVGLSSLPDDFPVPFTSFDEVNGPRRLRGDAIWTLDVFIREALHTAGLPGTPIARVLKYEVVSLASPQVALTLDRGKEFRRATVFDAGPFLGHLEVVDVLPGTTVLQALALLRSLRAPLQASALLTTGRFSCFVNGQIFDPAIALPPDADVVQFDRPSADYTTALPLHVPSTQAPSILEEWCCSF